MQKIETGWVNGFQESMQMFLKLAGQQYPRIFIMKLYFYVPNDPIRLFYFYIVEAAILFANYIFIVIWIVVTPKVRVHIHLKVLQ